MTQALLIQQAALTRLNERVKELEASQSAPSMVAVFSPACLVAKAALLRALRRHRHPLLPSQHPVPAPFWAAPCKPPPVWPVA